MSNDIIAIFGGTGFLGRYVVKHLADAGYRLRVLSRNPLKANHLKPLASKVGQLSVEYADLRNEESITNALKGCDGVVNLVGILAEGRSQKFATIHAQGAEVIAQHAKAEGITKLVHISSLGVDRADRSKYARTKYTGEKAVLEAFPEATILRPSVVFGPEDNFFNMFAGMARLSPALPLIGGGKTLFQPVYVDDVAKAVSKSFSDDNAQGKIYELGGPDIKSFKELLQYMLTVLEKDRVLLPIPFPIAGLMGRGASILPNPPLTADQVTLLHYDNVVDEDALTFKDLSITPTAMQTIVPNYLSRYVFKG